MSLLSPGISQETVKTRKEEGAIVVFQGSGP